MALVPVTYVVSQTTAYNENSEQQHTNCSSTKIKSSTVLLCGKGSILADGNRGNINSRDGLQNSELQQFFIWNNGRPNIAPFVSIVFEKKIIPHSIDLYFHFSPQHYINIPEITLYWSNKDPVDRQNVLPFQRTAYLVGSGIYKYKTILEINDITPFTYMQMKMKALKTNTSNSNDHWIFLSEIKVYANRTKGTVINKT